MKCPVDRFGKLPLGEIWLHALRQPMECRKWMKDASAVVAVFVSFLGWIPAVMALNAIGITGFLTWIAMITMMVIVPMLIVSRGYQVIIVLGRTLSLLSNLDKPAYAYLADHSGYRELDSYLASIAQRLPLGGLLEGIRTSLGSIHGKLVRPEWIDDGDWDPKAAELWNRVYQSVLVLLAHLEAYQEPGSSQYTRPEQQAVIEGAARCLQSLQELDGSILDIMAPQRHLSTVAFSGGSDEFLREPLPSLDSSLDDIDATVELTRRTVKRLRDSQ